MSDITCSLSWKFREAVCFHCQDNLSSALIVSVSSIFSLYIWASRQFPIIWYYIPIPIPLVLTQTDGCTSHIVNWTSNEAGFNDCRVAVGCIVLNMSQHPHTPYFLPNLNLPIHPVPCVSCSLPLSITVDTSPINSTGILLAAANELYMHYWQTLHFPSFYKYIFI